MAPSRPQATLPLPVRIFHAAMQRQSSLDAYATSLEIPGDTLRALLSAQIDQLDPELALRLAAAHGQGAEAELAPATRVVAAESFSAWLDRQMEGVSQTSLRARTQLDAPLMRAFVNGKKLPDADQAERIARALYVDSAEMAHIIVADMAQRAEGTSRGPARRLEATDTTAATQGESAASNPALPDRPAPARARRRRQSTEPADAPPAAAADPVAAQAPEAPTSPASNEADQGQTVPASGDADVAAPAAGRRRRTPARVPADPPAAQAPPPPATSPTVETAIVAEQAAPEPESTPLQPEADTAPAPARRRGRKPAGSTDAASAAASTPASAAPHASGREDTPPIALEADNDAGDNAGDMPTSAKTTPMVQARKAVEVPTASSPTTPADARAVETTLQLSSDEVRLIRIWRRLHPHGQRATLQYIGSLLVEE